MNQKYGRHTHIVQLVDPEPLAEERPCHRNDEERSHGRRDMSTVPPTRV